MFFTNDTDFDDINLQGEFEETTHRKIVIKKEWSDLKVFLDETQQLKFDLDFLRRNFDPIFMTKLRKLLSDNFHTVVVDQRQYKIIDFKKDYRLVDIAPIGDSEFEMMISFHLIHETPYTGYCAVNKIYSYYETDEKLVFLIRLQLGKFHNNQIYLLLLRE